MTQPIRTLKIAVTLILAGLLSWQTCFAQDDPWDRVKLVEPGKKLAVKLRSGRSVNGKMEAWSTDGVAVRQGKDRVVQVKKSDVAQVSLVMGRSRGRKAALAGLLTGGILGGFTGVACAAGSNCDVPPGAIAAGGALFFGGIAAGIAALFPPNKEAIFAGAGSGPSKK